MIKHLKANKEAKSRNYKDPTFVDYVKPAFLEEFAKHCEINSKHFYGAGCILTAHLVMEALMSHTFHGVWKRPKTTPKVAWNDAMKQTNYHSGMSAAATAVIIANYSPRGEEFAQWCKNDDVVMVDWDLNKQRILRECRGCGHRQMSSPLTFKCEICGHGLTRRIS